MPNTQPDNQLHTLWRADEPKLRRLQRDIHKRARQGKPVDRLQAKYDELLTLSRGKVLQRQQSRPDVSYPDLPVAREVERIRAALNEHQVIVVAGETGSGKTTQLPKLCLEAGRGLHGLIGHTQPRRLAARTVAQRIASELHTELGAAVGYQVRFVDQVSDATYIKLMTDGILLAEIQHDPYLNRYDTLIIDEAHERSLNIDFLLGYLKLLLPKRPDLKVIITSATIDVERFSKHFDNAPVIEVSGRTYPVEIRYRPLEELSPELDQAEAIDQALQELDAEGGRRQGDVLVFLSGEREIRAAAKQLRRSSLMGLEVLPLYARLSAKEQQRIFDEGGRRGWRIVLATNVAETSLTVPGIRFVIDTGTARISRYSYRSKVQRLPIEPISQASANQRAGRCGRIAPGVCVRLYSEEDFQSRPEFTEPEVQRTNLASVILQMLNMRLGSIEDFPFVDAPDRRFINDGYKLLEELAAVDKGELTPLGKTLVRMPVDPRMARILQAASSQGCLQEALIVVSALSIQDPRERPADKQQAADEKHRRFTDKESDFAAFVNLWNYLEEQRQELSNNQFRKLCQREFIAPSRAQEWRELHWQLKLLCRDNGWTFNREPVDHQTLHRAILAGFLSHVAKKDEQHWYRGTRNRKLRIFPGSGLFKKNPSWIVAAELAETSQLFARCVARIEPEWIPGINDSILKYQYFEPHWQARAGRVSAYRQTSLYGLVIQDRQRVNFGAIDPVLAREIMIRSALVEGQYRGKAAFFAHNKAAINKVLELESKLRRRDLLISDDAMFAFYDRRLPAHIVSSKHLESWLKQASEAERTALNMTDDDVLAVSQDRKDVNQFPDTWRWGELRLPLRYRFEPGHQGDGVTLVVPLALLNRVPDYFPEWLVPGLLEDKCVALVKALPKQWRKKLMPIPVTVGKALATMESGDQPLSLSLAGALKKVVGEDIPPDLWRGDLLDSFYLMNFQVVDDRGKVIAESRDLQDLKKRYGDESAARLQAESEHSAEQQILTEWTLESLPQKKRIRQGGAEVTAYPALVDRGDAVELTLLDTAEEADSQSRRGVVRLLTLQLIRQLKPWRDSLLRSNAEQLQLAALGAQRKDWVEDIIEAAVYQTFVQGQALPRSREDYAAVVAKTGLDANIKQVAELAQQILEHAASARRALKKLTQLTWIETVSDIREQLDALLFKGFLRLLPLERLEQYPRYLLAIGQRLDRLEGQYQRERQLLIGLRNLTEPLWRTISPDKQASEPVDSRLIEYRWLLEEYRVSLYAQTLGTKAPVSEKRLKTLWREIELSRAPRV
ncbi:ATP-dependent helicase HrpA [Litorivivens lipolytica]|uniref:ATP-dependent helicase HrpA n=1 Tax=Litorivivens lipolytica TaxID=1524264 RepID=A0A7W4W4G6_9GAMM|nr:ATP-dependent RNA helicase HrpA [Litorivivens lipolytica]MBB3046707.1 ATP-dependent helicase HrpA [Litorivivens lipolytica]